MELRDFFQECPKVALGFSGGVDSAYLLYAALDHGAQVRPYFIKTAFQPQFELEDARRLCAQLGVELTVVELDVLQIPGVAENPRTGATTASGPCSAGCGSRPRPTATPC